MKCSSCGSESNADARFCSNCGAKLHRETDTLFRTASPPDSPAAAIPPAPAVAAARRAPRGAGWLLLGAALIVGAYVVYRQFLPGGAAPEGTTAAPPATSSSPPAAAPSPPAPEAAAPSAAPAATAPPAAMTPPPATPQAAATPPPATAPAPATSPSRPSAARPRPAKPPPPPPQPVAVAPPPPATAAAPVAAAPAKPDRFQQLGDALARCRGRDLIGRAVCEQRARLQYCDGYWDQVPQCSGVGKLNPATN